MRLTQEATDGGVPGAPVRVVRTYVYGPTGVDDVVRRQDHDPGTGAVTRTYWFHANDLGSVELVTDESGNPVEKYEYDAWGKPRFWTWAGDGWSETAESGIGNRFLFTGREWDAEVGLYDFRARTYSPRLGRFLQVDPVEPAMQHYLYVANQPAAGVDPSGLEGEFWNWLMGRGWRSNAEVLPEQRAEFQRINRRLATNPARRESLRWGTNLLHAGAVAAAENSPVRSYASGIRVLEGVEPYEPGVPFERTLKTVLLEGVAGVASVAEPASAIAELRSVTGVGTMWQRAGSSCPASPSREVGSVGSRGVAGQRRFESIGEFEQLYGKRALADSPEGMALFEGYKRGLERNPNITVSLTEELRNSTKLVDGKVVIEINPKVATAGILMEEASHAANYLRGVTSEAVLEFQANRQILQSGLALSANERDWRTTLLAYYQSQITGGRPQPPR